MKVVIYYTKPSYFQQLMLSNNFEKTKLLERITRYNIIDTHVTVAVIDVKSITEAYRKMQCDFWKIPKSKNLTKILGLNHTSMAVGDIIFVPSTDEYLVVFDVGWRQI